MTNRTTDVPRPGAGVRFGIPDTAACSNRTTNRTPSEREPDNEPDTAEPDTLHAHEPDNRSVRSVAFDVRGLPVPQGSARAFVAGGRAIVATDANRTSSPLGAWRSAIATEARAAIGSAPPLSGPVRVGLAFRFPRPKAHYLPANGRRPAPVLRLDAPTWHACKPDADKLARAALDALTAVVLADDCQVSRPWCPSDTRIPPRVLASRSRSHPSR